MPVIVIGADPSARRYPLGKVIDLSVPPILNRTWYIWTWPGIAVPSRVNPISPVSVPQSVIVPAFRLTVPELAPDSEAGREIEAELAGTGP